MVSRTAKRGLRQFNAGDTVLARNYGRGEKWVRRIIIEVLGSRHYMVKVAGGLWKRHVDQLLSHPVEFAPASNSSEFEHHSVPLETPSNMDQSGDIVPDSTIPSTPVPLKSTLDEFPLTGNSEEFSLESPLTGVSRHIDDSDTANVTLTSPLPENSDSADVDDTLLVHPSFSSENLVSTNTEKLYPTRATRRPPIYLKDYELK